MQRLRRAAFLPARHCPFCFSDKTEWQQASGNGTVYTYSVMRRAPVPYAIAYVTLAEGPTMMTNIVDCDLDGIKVGQAVKLVFKPSDGGPPVPCSRRRKASRVPRMRTTNPSPACGRGCRAKRGG